MPDIDRVDDDEECYCAELLEEDAPCKPCQQWQQERIKAARERERRTEDSDEGLIVPF